MIPAEDFFQENLHIYHPNNYSDGMSLMDEEAVYKIMQEYARQIALEVRKECGRIAGRDVEHFVLKTNIEQFIK